MAKFGLNVAELEDNIDKYKTYKRKSINNVNSVYDILSNIDYAWNDVNSESFKKMVNKDKNKVNEYFDFLGDFYNEIERFKDDISSTLSRYGCSSRATVSYDSSRIQECLDYLGDAIGYLNDAVTYIGDDIVYPSDFVELDLVNELLNNLIWIRNDIDSYDDDICNLSNSFLTALDNSRNRKAGSSDFDYNFNSRVYNWSNVYISDVNLNKPTITDDYNIGKKQINNNSNLNENSSYSKIEVNQEGTKSEVINDSLDSTDRYSQIDSNRNSNIVNDSNLKLSENSNYSSIETKAKNTQNLDNSVKIDSNDKYKNEKNIIINKDFNSLSNKGISDDVISKVRTDELSKQDNQIGSVKLESSLNKVENMSVATDNVDVGMSKLDELSNIGGANLSSSSDVFSKDLSASNHLNVDLNGGTKINSLDDLKIDN